MKPRASFAAIVLALVAVPVLTASNQSEQARMRDDTGARGLWTLRQIEARILPLMPGRQYLGPEYDASAMTYRLKFIRDGRVTYVDVDARTGRIIAQSR
jgi:hypothetical protein